MRLDVLELEIGGLGWGEGEGGEIRRRTLAAGELPYADGTNVLSSWCLRSNFRNV